LLGFVIADGAVLEEALPAAEAELLYAVFLAALRRYYL
jgi:hypothetical protein